MKHTEGFSLVEVLLALALAAIAITGFFGALLYAERVSSGRTTVAAARLRADECLEVVRWMRDAGTLASVSAGTYGLEVAAGQWVLADAPDTADGLTRTVAVSEYDADTLQVDCMAAWTDGASGSVSVTTLLAR